MKTREPRQSIMVPVRIRQDAKWSDASIRNVSSRGMMLQMEDPPPKGSFIEIRRQQAVMIGQVRWSGDGRCGVRTQDSIPIAYLTSKAASAGVPRPDQAGAVDRRASVRVLTPQEVAENSRIKAMLFERLSFAAAVVIGALVLASLLYGVLSKPFAAIAARLG